jgi:hypothetical protein
VRLDAHGVPCAVCRSTLRDTVQFTVPPRARDLWTFVCGTQGGNGEGLRCDAPYWYPVP